MLRSVVCSCLICKNMLGKHTATISYDLYITEIFTGKRTAKHGDIPYFVGGDKENL